MDPTPSSIQSQSNTPVPMPSHVQSTFYPGKPLQQPDTVILSDSESDDYSNGKSWINIWSAFHASWL